MYLLLIFLPLASSISAGFLGRYLGSNGSAFRTTSCLFVSFGLSLFLFYEVSYFASPTFLKLGTWIDIEFLNVDWGFLFDGLTVSMCIIITFISSLVHFYSTEYMSHDPHLPRFMSYLSLFTFFMLILVTADNYIQMFVGWEGVGLCSYLLINFWFTRIQANKAAIKAMLMNRIGDFSLLIGIFLIFVSYKSVDYATVSSLTPFFYNKSVSFLNNEIKLLFLINLFLFLGAVGKSAQLGLHTWLPDAMEGPTPVSALIHAATMVTAGVFLIVRSSFLYEFDSDMLEYVSIIGSITAFFASTTGLLQNDLKKVIAYSTCSQLGYMIFACGLSNYQAGFFHLINHAFFKALLFLGAGSVIHAVLDEQDMRKMGGLKSTLPFTYSMMTIGSLALIGFPFLSGFYSKDLILEVAYGKHSTSGYFSYFLGSFGAFFTSFYSTRLAYLTFISTPNGNKPVLTYAVDSGKNICISLACLSVPSMFIGYYSKDLMVGPGGVSLSYAIFVHPNNFNLFDAEFVSLFFKLLPLLLSCLGVLSAFLLYHFNSVFLFKLKMSKTGQKIYGFLNRKWFFDKIYNELLGQFFFKSGYNYTYYFIDRGVFEIIGPTGISLVFSKLSNYVHSFQTRNMYHSLLTILIGLCFIVFSNFLIKLYLMDPRLYPKTSFFIDYRLYVLFIVILLGTISGVCNSDG